MVEPTVSVIVPTFNRAGFLAECLDSVLSQTLPPTQVIVINDGSTDETRQIIKLYDGRVEHIEKANGGKSSALNVGMSRVTGNYVWIMDDDDVALPDALERHLEILQKRPELGFTYSSCCNAATRAEDGRIVPGSERKLPNIGDEEVFVRLLERNFTTHPGIVVRTSCYKTVGQFDLELIRSQDYDMVLRLSLHFPCARVDGPTFYYRKHGLCRGSQQDRFASKHIPAKWMVYDQRIFKRLRQELPLWRYLPVSYNGGPPVSADKGQAYIQRMAVMGLKGLKEEMLEDLGLAIKEHREVTQLSLYERAIIIRLMQAIGDDVLLDSSVRARINRMSKNGVGPEIRFEFGRGVYSRACWHWKEKHYPHAFRLFVAACHSLGLSNLARMIGQKLQDISLFHARS